MAVSLFQYARFLIVGTVVGLITVAVREVIGYLQHTDTQVSYSISVVSAYAIGILLSFLLNRKFTFGENGTAGWARFIPFIGVALVGMFCTWLLSLVLRYGLNHILFLSKYSAPLAFVAATVLASGITYPLNATLIFKRRSAPMA